MEGLSVFSIGLFVVGEDQEVIWVMDRPFSEGPSVLRVIALIVFWIGLVVVVVDWSVFWGLVVLRATCSDVSQCFK